MRIARRAVTLGVAIAVVAGCGDDPVTQLDPELTLTVTPASFTINQANFDEAMVRVVRVDSPNEVVLSVSGGGIGVAGLIQNIDVDGNEVTATFRITVAGDAVPGPYTFQIRAANDDADDVTQLIAVDVPPPPTGGDLRR